MDTRTRRWLEYEQTVNERIGSDSSSFRLDLRNQSVRPAYRPERRGVWPQEVVWLPDDRVRTYGPLNSGVHAAFGQRIPAGRTPLLLHPQAPAAHRQLRKKYGSTLLDEVWVTPTASYRTVVACRGGRPPVLLKLSMGVRISRQRRSITEYYLVTGILVSRLLEAIPVAIRRRLAFDWFPEPAGVVETQSGTGWILRHFPVTMNGSRAGDLVPVFSLIAPRGERVPLLVDLIRDSGLRPEQFVVQRLLVPYVRVLAYLLLEEGIQVQGHAQNVLMEVDSAGRLSDRIVLRDLTDTSVSLALRLAKRKPLPSFHPGFLPRTTPFPLVRSVTDYSGFAGGRRPIAASETVERYGLRTFVWSLNTSLARYFPRYDPAAVERRYLRLWREQAIHYLEVEPLISDEPKGIAMDEALDYFLSHADWRKVGCTEGVSLPSSAEPLPSDDQIRRRGGSVYRRVESAWGDLYLDGDRPVFLRPAF